MHGEIDFVVLWVDGNDEEWLKDKKIYRDNQNEVNRWRNWELMHFWFRGVERFAPWVRKVHFITCGHYPKWLNLNYPKLNFVKHSDYISKEYLPTFNSNVIELNVHKIESLAEKFVLFNDDMFIIRDTKEEDFFKNNLPCDQAILGCIQPADSFEHTTVNNFCIINKHFHKNEIIKNNIFKWFNFSYGIKNFQTLLLLPWSKFSGMNDSHLPISHTKHIFEEVWKVEPSALEQISKRKFRDNESISHWLFRYWRIMKGEFQPQKRLGKKFEISNDKINNREIYDYIKSQENKIICINDSIPDVEFELRKKELKDAFELILPNKSKFEMEI
jgi:hypothetical protein